MLIRIGGGISGIKEYLENGQKQGRALSRDELDERIVLGGDLDVTNDIIQSLETSGDKYLHITLSFKEDEIDRGTLESIVQDFESFAFSAYGKDEYSMYAEAHMPKIKSYVDGKSGDSIERKPHIHIVIPRQNLLSGTNFDLLHKPVFDKKLNKVIVPESQLEWVNAFQEHVNNKYGLASPKEHQRIELVDVSDIISRHSDDVFKGDKGKELKSKLLSEMVSRGIEDYGQFKKMVAEYGTVSTGRSQDSEERYLKVTLPGQTKAARLDKYVFSREFVELPTAEKQKKMAAEVQAKYQVAGDARRDPEYIAQKLEEWYSSRAKELKYLNSGDTKFYQAYRQAGTETKQQMLAERENRFYSKHREDKTNDQSNERPADRAAGINGFTREYPFKPTGHERSADSRQRYPEPFGKGTPPQSLDSVRNLSGVGVVRFASRGEVLLPSNAPHQLEHGDAEPANGLRRPADRQPVSATGRSSDSVIAQRARDLKEGQQERSAGRNGDLQEIKQQLDARRLLAELSHSHGVIPEKYQVTKAKDGGDRIKCGTRNLNVSDFLTKELNLSWKEAEKTLRESYSRQTGRELQRGHREKPGRQLWAEFQAGRGDRQQLRSRQWDELRTDQGQRLEKIKTEFHAKKGRIQGDKSLTGAHRKAALSVARMERLAKEAAHRDSSRIERDQLKAEQGRPTMDQYRDFLAEKAQAGNEHALAELRRMAPPQVEQNKDNAPEVKPAEPMPRQEREPIHKAEAFTYQVHRNGDVTYQRAGQNVLRDQGRSVQMLQADAKTIETGLRLAQQKFGHKLALSGPQDFQEKAARIAAEAGLKIEFTDARLNRIMQERTAAIAVEKARDQEARKLAQEFIKQREAGKGQGAHVEATSGPQKAQEPLQPLQPTPAIDSKPANTHDGSRYSGQVSAVDDKHVYQAYGRDTIRHDRKNLSDTPKPGDQVTIQYRQGQGTITNKAQEQAKRRALDTGHGL